MLAGAAVNAWLLPGFEPAFDPLASLNLLATGERLQPTVGAVPSLVASAALIALIFMGIWRRGVRWVNARRDGRRDESCCSG
jgi:uncharacterized protein (DUF2062 family)